MGLSLLIRTLATRINLNSNGEGRDAYQTGEDIYDLPIYMIESKCQNMSEN